MSDDSDIAVSVDGTAHTILCGHCKAKVSLQGEIDTDTAMVGCADCDNWADQKKAFQIVGEYITSEMQLALNRVMKDTARKSKALSFEGQTTQNKRYRFIV
ncbi:hypothetical protein [Pseudophaeobacter sp.]|jgi:hypothetical protein|uniref:hypothetical protein n=1 Tax=Pseudophaeobacter sp. TaxID=1971739 RepID=UPI0032D9874A